MILIASRQDDGTTLYVIEWLKAFNKDFIRLNTDDELTIFSHFDSRRSELVVLQDGKEINLLKAKSIWIRRHGFSLNNIPLNKEVLEHDIFFDHDGYHKAHINAENKLLIGYIHKLLKNKCSNVLGSYEFGDVNKMNVLEEAKSVGLKIPESFIVTSRRQLLELYNENKSLLTKSLGAGVYIFKGDLSYYSYTERLTQKSIEKFPAFFFPSLIQIEVKKKFELRIFYLRGDFYSMAIFSQKNKNTSVDFRKPNFDNVPNRKVPYNLPEPVKNKLRTLMNNLHLDTGSIDIIVDSDGDYVFLEVNPVGQFSMTSHPCNFYLEKKVAELL